jgi:hypothetical protein
MVGEPMPGERLDAEPLLRELTSHGVDFVVIGGLAGVAHGSSYPTYDLDVAYSRDEPNLERLAAALRQLEVTLTNAPEDLPFQIDARSLGNGANFTFDTPHGRFDILGDVPGMRDFGKLREGASVAEIEGVAVLVASIDHLIAMKRAANRAKDKLMLEEYIVIADELERADRGPT